MTVALSKPSHKEVTTTVFVVVEAKQESPPAAVSILITAVVTPINGILHQLQGIYE